MSLQIGNAFQVILDKNGAPLDDGYVFIGEVGQNPEAYPIQIFYDENLTIPAPQPIKTTNGYFARNGNAAKIFCAVSSCSITVRDKNNILQWLDLGYTGVLNQEIQDEVKRGIANRYDSSLTYNSGERVILTNGNIVKSTINGNANNPNVNMTGWVYDPSNVGAKPSDISQPDSTASGVNSNIYIGGYGVYDPDAETKTRPVWDAIGGVAPGASANALKLTGHVIKDGLDSAINIGGRVGYYNYVGEKGSLSLTYGGDNFNGHLAGIVTAFHCDLISDANGVGSHGIACGGSFAQIAGDYSGSFAGTRKKVFGLSSAAVGGSSVQIGDLSDATLVRRGGTLAGLNLRMVAGYESVMLGGSANTHTSGNRSATLGGESNEMAANWSAILGGRSIKVTADYSVARGWGVVGDIPYASAYNNGYFSTVADNQTYQMMLRRVGVNTSTDVFLSASGGSGVDVYTVKPNQLGLANFDVQGFNTDTKSVYAFNVKVVFSTLSGSLVIKSTKVDVLHDDDKTTTNSFSVTGVSVASGARLGIKITTTAAINSRWTANGFITIQNL